MDVFTGTWRLIRLALRRDRIKLPLWVITIAGLAGASAAALVDAYGTTTQRLEYAATTAPSIVARAFGGVLDGPSLGAITMVELFQFTAVLLAFMSTLAIIRHTRQNEEMGSTELIRSAIVGRYASLSAALIVVIGANIIVGVLFAVILGQTEGLSMAGVWGMAAALAATGIVFAAIAAVVAQLTDGARTANALAGSIIGATFLVRAIGDSLGSVSADGLSSSSMWLTWFSPFGWGQMIFPFTQQHWWVFSLFILFTIALLIMAFKLMAYRDVGLGIFPARKGPKNAPQWLRSPLGIAFRLQRGILFGWGITFAILGGLYGIMAEEYANMLAENEVAKQYLQGLSAGGSVSSVFFSAMINISAIVLVGYVLQALLKLRNEEITHHLEALLSTPISRVRWLWAHVWWMLCGVVLMTLALAIFTAVAYVLAADVAWSQTLGDLLRAALVQLPAILTVAGVSLLFFGFLPNFMASISWGIFIIILLISQLGALLQLPSWIVNLSPFSHIPAVPLEPIQPLPLLILSFIALATAGIGAWMFSRRDIATS